ncbi:unnamed protein product [Amoebophrya sp. A25]|nr:unnamed protein product [Amoebophrya sp. A25]|eukprot:GSA25T00008391001.1
MSIRQSLRTSSGVTRSSLASSSGCTARMSTNSTRARMGLPLRAGGEPPRPSNHEVEEPVVLDLSESQSSSKSTSNMNTLTDQNLPIKTSSSGVGGGARGGPQQDYAARLRSGLEARIWKQLHSPDFRKKIEATTSSAKSSPGSMDPSAKKKKAELQEKERDEPQLQHLKNEKENKVVDKEQQDQEEDDHDADREDAIRRAQLRSKLRGQLHTCLAELSDLHQEQTRALELGMRRHFEMEMSLRRMKEVKHFTSAEKQMSLEQGRGTSSSPTRTSSPALVANGNATSGGSGAFNRSPPKAPPQGVVTPGEDVVDEKQKVLESAKKEKEDAEAEAKRKHDAQLQAALNFDSLKSGLFIGKKQHAKKNKLKQEQNTSSKTAAGTSSRTGGAGGGTTKTAATTSTTSAAVRKLSGGAAQSMRATGSTGTRPGMK